jgi:hypothetical protein
MNPDFPLPRTNQRMLRYLPKLESETPAPDKPIFPDAAQACQAAPPNPGYCAPVTDV